MFTAPVKGLPPTSYHLLIAGKKFEVREDRSTNQRLPGENRSSAFVKKAGFTLLARATLLFRE